MHINLLCACWHSEAVRGSSSSSSRRLLISLWVTSSLFLCPELTDAPCPYYEGSVPPSPRWRPHSQGPHTLPFQGTRQVPQVNGEGVCSEWRGASPCSSWVLRVHISTHQSLLHYTLSPFIHFSGSKWNRLYKAFQSPTQGHHHKRSIKPFSAA